MLKTILATWPRDRDMPERAFELAWRRAVLDGTIYDQLPGQFHEERNGAGEYVPLRDRQPSVKYPLCRTVVEDSVSLLFSEGHFPALVCDDEGTKEALEDLIKETRLDDVMIDAALRGSVGSSCVLLRILKGRVFFSVFNTEFLTPKWQEDAPDTLESVTERYKVRGSVLIAAGYDEIPKTSAQSWYWFQRVWTDQDEEWYQPQRVVDAKAADAKPPALDTKRSVNHQFGFVPMVWIRNLPGGDGPDGGCTFRAAVETGIEIDYQLSQAGRGLKYASDPTLVIREPAASDGTFIKSPANALVVSEKGDAKLLEIGGTASAAVMEYVTKLRDLALESIHGNRTNADKLSAAHSGRAIELMNQGLIWLADRLRASYGEHGLLPLLRMTVKASAVFPLTVMGNKVSLADKPITLKWPRWYAPSAEDRQSDASTLVSLFSGGLMSRETAVGAWADSYDVEDVPAELARIMADEKAADARAAEQAAAVTAAEVIPE